MDGRSRVARGSRDAAANSKALISRRDRDSLGDARMAYLPDLTAPRSWEPEAPQRHSRVFGVIVALFFALLLCAASALATAVYLDGVHVDAQVALNDEPTAGGRPDGGAAALPDDPKEAADAAWVAGRKAGYKK